jgi:ABC-type phosphate/phosphonate transport system permease subunit
MPHRVLAAAAREVRDVLRAATPTHRRLRDHLTVVVIVTVGVDLVFTVLAFLFERHAAQTEVKTIGSALFWTTTQLLTVSSSIKNPVSTVGRILDVLMEIYAITVIATLAGAFGAFLQKRGEEMSS